MVDTGKSGDFIIKKETMIKKNKHEIASVYEIEKGVSRTTEVIVYVETWKRFLWSSAQSYP